MVKVTHKPVPEMSERARKLVGNLGIGYTEILEIYENDRFCEITITRGGDVVTYRCYGDGRVTVR